MMPRIVEFYEDSDGNCEVCDALRSISRSDPRHTRHIQNKIDLLRNIGDIDRDATQSHLVKRPTAYIYILLVKGGGGFAFRLPFFVPACKGGELIVFTHCEKRRGLDRSYASLVEQATARRQDWIHRNCRGNANAR